MRDTAHKFYAAFDPGFDGGLGLINAAGTTLRAWDMPVTGKGKDRNYDLAGLSNLYDRLKRFPDVLLGIEWPTVKPGDFGDVAGRAEKFGRGKGILQAFAYCWAFDTQLVVPTLWKGRLGLPGKSDPECLTISKRLLEATYGSQDGILLGTRGGLKDGRLDALLIAHFLRLQHAIGHLTSHRRGSTEAQMAILGWGGNRRRHRLTLRETDFTGGT